MTRHVPMSPTRAFARLMEFTNSEAYRLAMEVTTLPSAGALLEIGFGSGRLLAMARKRWPEATLFGVDPTAEMVAMAAARRGLQSGILPDLRCCPANALPWGDNVFDAVVSVHAFQFWDPPEQCVLEVRRVLKPGGNLVLILRDHSRGAPDWLPNPISRSGREIDATRDLLARSGFVLSLQEPDQKSLRIIAKRQA